MKYLSPIIRLLIIWTPLLFASIPSVAQTDSLHSYIRTLVIKYQSGTLDDDELTTLRAYGFGLENKAFELAAQQSSPEKTLSAADSALHFWVSIRESEHEAALRQLRSSLLRQLARNDEARVEIQKSAAIYQDLKMADQTASCMHEMSLVMESSGMIDSAIWYQQQATNYWITQKDPNQFIAGNNHLIYLNSKALNFEEAIKIQTKTENELTIELNWKPTIDFYYVSYLLYKAKGDLTKADNYYRLYQNWLSKLKEEGMEVKSSYF